MFEDFTLADLFRFGESGQGGFRDHQATDLANVIQDLLTFGLALRELRREAGAQIRP